MTNKEFYKEQILDIACKGKSFGLNEESMTICECNDIPCFRCHFHKIGTRCIDNIEKWCNEEYIEPCEFEKDELVEVSDNGVDWCLRYFSHKFEGVYYCFTGGYKSTDVVDIYDWGYCRKYGTLGEKKGD